MEFGKKAKDKISGFEGIITGKCFYITGCSQYLLQPPAKDGDFKEGHWFDEGRLEYAGGGVSLESVQTEDPGCDIPAPVK